jgi:heterodisulfide reductase subunit A
MVESKHDEIKDLDEVPKIFVAVCQWGINIAEIINCKELAEFSKTLPNVVGASDYISLCTEAGAEFIKEKMEETGANRLIVASCTPITHEPVFQSVLESMGLDSSYLEFVNIREHSSFVHRNDKPGAQKVAEDAIRSGVARAKVLEKVLVKEVGITQKTLIIGGGVAGLTAAIDLAEQGFEVHLVEKSPTIGGKMAMLDRTFPTDDCSIWILGPVMLESARIPGINIHTYSEVEDVSGFVGNFDIKIRKKARYVTNDCNGCGACMEVCPAYGYNEFNEGLDPRSAIYIAFTQAVPSLAQIDMNRCIKCGLCQKACELNAIDFDQQDEIISLKVGSIIVATGWDEYEPETGYLGYNIYPNVITQMKLERILAPNGPTVGHLVRPSDGKRPKRVLFIQCVGSRDLNKNTYCSSGVCCMITIKNSKLIKQHYPDTEIDVAYMDIRAAGKDYEEYFTASRKEGIRYIRTSISRLSEDPETHNIKVNIQNTLRESLGIKELEYDLVVLSAAMVPPKGIHKLQETLKLETSLDGFFKEFHSRLNPIDTKIPGISLAGVAQGPKSIAESISQGRAAASSLSRLMGKEIYRIKLIRAHVDKERCAKCGLCELNCQYKAISLNADGAEVDEILCRGCGSCLPNCPSEAITLRYYREPQYEKQIDAILGEI